MEECAICVSKYKRIVSCKKCDIKTCMSCLKRFLLDPERPQKASCMNCKVQYTKKDLVTNISLAFVLGAYKAHRENLLFEHQKSLLPETMQIAINTKNREDLTREIVECETNLMITQNQFKRPVTSDDVDFNLRLFDEMNRLRKKEYIAKVSYDNIPPDSVIINGKTKVNKKYFHCPSKECRGFVTTTSNKCDICECKICKECMEEKTVDHVCNPDTLETVKLVKSDCKNCPKCMAQIFRISGCPQMFCTVCHIAFDWNTGNIVDRGVIHNPHYFDYILRNRDRDANGNIDDNQGCEGLEPVRFTAFYRSRTIPMNSEFPKIFQFVSHLFGHYMQYMRPQAEPDNVDIRVKYILNRIEEKEFKTVLHKREKAYEKNKEVYDIMETFVVMFNDVVRRYMRTPTDPLEDMLLELHKIRLLTNASLLENVGEVFKCVVHYIPENWSTLNF
jgi:hypothetical protein